MNFKMTLSLQEIQILQEIAQLLYNFLPGTPHPFADQSISFSGIASELGLGDFWLGGSKLPSITHLLKNTFEKRKELFPTIILETVRRGIIYRGSKGKPITRREIEVLNQLLLKLKCRIPEVYDRNFLNTLSLEGESDKFEEEKINDKTREELKVELMKIEKLSPSQKGFAFERFLTKLFGLFGLKPRAPFRFKGEQIDGSFELDSETYLIEAKWRNEPVGLSELLSFYGKIEGKAKWTRGLFISYSGFTREALTAFSKGRATNLVILTGQDLYFVLSGHEGEFLDLAEAIRAKVRYAGETGDVNLSVYELLLHKGKTKLGV